MEQLRAGSLQPTFDEMNALGDGVRQPYASFAAWLSTLRIDDLKRKRTEAEALFRRSGITFAVYGDEAAAERLIPFDIIPRIISAAEWRRLAAGIEQRVTALNAFMYDIYHRQEILKAGRIPSELIIQNSAFLPEMIGAEPPLGIYSHIAGIDIVRTAEHEFFVLEDNTRTPSGVSYVLENRETMMHMFPDLFASNRVAPVENYPVKLLKTLESVAPRSLEREPVIALLTPGLYNSAYFEHSFLADQMGIELVEGHDLIVMDGTLHMKTTRGLTQVDVVYRRIDDEFLDPVSLDPTSVVGVPGIFDVYRAGRVTIVNAPGAGIADDKAIYGYIPEIIEFYMGQPPILKNVPTFSCRRPDDFKYVLEHLEELVVKEVHGSGGYGMLVGPAASKEEIEAFRAKLKAGPDRYIAQPTLALSTCPTLVEDGVAPRHVDMDLAHSIGGGEVKDTLDCLHGLMRAVREAIKYEIGTSHAHTTAAEALADGKGVCQDHAHVFISAARVLGVPSRYVNGYFLAGTIAPSEVHHAWAEAWVEGLGWVGFDPASGICPTERYARLASGLDAGSAAPIRGAQRGGEKETLDVAVEVEQQGAQQ